MNDSQFAIRHRIEVEVPPEALYEAIATPEGIAAWWTPRVSGESREGGVLAMRFGDGDLGPDMRVEALRPAALVEWTCVEGPWKGMRFSFDIAPHPRGSVLAFRNTGWADASDFHMHCNSKWGFFLAVSLKSYLETGRGQPNPADPAI